MCQMIQSNKTCSRLLLKVTDAHATRCWLSVLQFWGHFSAMGCCLRSKLNALWFWQLSAIKQFVLQQLFDRFRPHRPPCAALTHQWVFGAMILSPVTAALHESTFSGYWTLHTFDAITFLDVAKVVPNDWCHGNNLSNIYFTLQQF